MKFSKEYREILKEDINTISVAVETLAENYEKCKVVGVKTDYSDSEQMIFEALSSRFGRLSDILFKKIFKTLDWLEYQDASGTLIDIFNHAEKREIVDSAEKYMDVRIFRNKIVHEYSLAPQSEIYPYLLEFTPLLIEAAKNTIEYVHEQKLIESDKL